MTKPEALKLLKLLSALESWSFAGGSRLPEHLYDDLQREIELMCKVLLDGNHTNS